MPLVGSLVEEFQLPDLMGQHHRISDYRGKIVLMNFWATWCKPCITEMPALQASYDKLKDTGFVVLAINELEDENQVRDHVRQYGHTFTVLLDRQNRIANQFGVYGLPVSVFIDADGRVREYIKGGLLTEGRVSEIVSRLQEGQSASHAAPR
ncbi:TlpA disulfide reductase family protein [Nitrospira sp. KM1]|uniref:TlpA disulfide reductase family protein n=1 Tax=Nitrospira sp. KM1 TaxID=1936990 RepID=UPI0015652D0F|nr:TlpA disulfide reductase family protein [Nitrospira sp. KM1]